MQLSDLYGDFAAVLRSSPHGESVFSQRLLPNNSHAVAVADVLSDTCETSIDEKLSAGGFYDQPYNFFHDLKLAFGRLIAEYPQNAPEYDEIASLFKFAIDLLVREADRLGFTSRHIEKTPHESNPEPSGILENPPGPVGGENPAFGSGVIPNGLMPPQPSVAQNGFAPPPNGMVLPPGMAPPTSLPNGIPNGAPNGMAPNFVNGVSEDDYLFQISQGFQTIKTEVQDWNGETYWITAANGPLFMSINNKAPIDPRDTAVSGNVHTVKLLPHVARAPESTLGFVSPLDQRIPQPDAPPTDLLSRFVHPNGHATFSPLWLTGQDAYSSFAPSSDSAGAVVGDGDAANVWVDKASRQKNQSSSDPKSQEPKSDPSQVEALPNPTEPDAKMEVDADVNTTQFQSQQSQLQPQTQFPFQTQPPAQFQPQSIPSLGGEDLEALLRWTPYSFVDDDEIEAAKSGKGAERELASKLLLELQTMQQERLAVPGSENEISDKERHVAFKSANILARLVDGAKHDEISLELDTRLPVLMRNYAGSLPAATDPFMHGPLQPFGGNSMPPQSQRLQTIAGLRSRSRSSRR